MFDNILYQGAADLLRDDIKYNRLPGAVLFSGSASSGKLTCALELARILSCHNNGDDDCDCSSCLRYKSLISPNILIVGSGDRSLEISAFKNTFLNQEANNTRYLEESRYLFIRAVRKLTIRFSDVLWEDDDKFSKIAPIVQKINENLEYIDKDGDLSEGEELVKIVDEIEKNCKKLESSFLYDAIPVSQIRRFSAWARLTSDSGKKVLIIENAESMAESARNALLKILEEPPSDTFFILTTTKRGAVMPTILSRVRTYSFSDRSSDQQKEIIEKVYHYIAKNGEFPETIDEFLQNYFPVQPSVIRQYADMYYTDVSNGVFPDVAKIVAGCKGFDPRKLFKIFMARIMECNRDLLYSARGVQSSYLVSDKIRSIVNNVTVYNQNPQAALEEFTRSMMIINQNNGGVFKKN